MSCPRDDGPDLFGWEPARRYPEAPGFKERGGTSQDAARAIEPRVTGLRAQVVALLARYPLGLTADEIAAILGHTVLAIRSRVSELNKLGLIVRTGQRAPNISGIDAAVWRVAKP